MMVCLHVLRVQRLTLEVVEREVHHHPGFSQRFEVEHAGVTCLVKQCVLSRQQSALSSVLFSEVCTKNEAYSDTKLIAFSDTVFWYTCGLQCPVLTVYNGCEQCAAILINACTTANTHVACSHLF